MFKFLKAARSLVNQGMSKEAIEQFAKNEFGEINELFQKQIDNLFKEKQGIQNIKIKDEVFDDTVIKLPVDDTGQPFNPNNPLKEYGKPKKAKGIEEIREKNKNYKLNLFKNLDDKKKLNDNEYEEFLEEIGGEDRLEAYDFDGTAGSAKKALKDDVEYEQSMFDQYKKEKAGKGKFTKAEYLIQRLKNTIKANPDDAYVQENFPNFIKEIEANPDLAKNENVFRELGGDLPSNQKITVYDDDTLDFATLKPTKKFQLNKERFQKDFNVADDEVERIIKLSSEDQQKELQKYINKDFKERIELSDYDVTDLEPNAEGGRAGFANGGTQFELPFGKPDYFTGSGKNRRGIYIQPDGTRLVVPIGPDDLPSYATGGRAGFYTGGITDVEPSLDDIGHGSDSLMSRTRLMSPGSQATTSTGLNYLLAEDNDNLRVPFAGGGSDRMMSDAEKEERAYNLMRDAMDREKFLKRRREEMEMDKKRLEEKKYGVAVAQGGRIGFSKGKGVDLLRRGFLKTMGAAGAGIAALKTGLLGFGGKGATKQAAKEIITTPAAAGKPAWFDALVTRVIREGDDVTKTMATKDRQNVYRKKIDDETEVVVTQDLDEGVTRIDIDDSTRNVTGFDDPPTVSLQVTDEIVEEGGARIKPEFKAIENDYRNYATDPDGGYETEFVENVVENTKDLTSDLTKVKSFATKKGPTMKEIVGSKKRKDNVKYANENPSSYAADRGPQYDPSDFVDDMADDFASGGIARMIGE